MSKEELDLYMIDSEAEQAQEVRDNPEKYEVSSEEMEDIMSSLKPVTSLDDILL
jgi:hypothetical protein